MPEDFFRDLFANLNKSLQVPKIEPAVEEFVRPEWLYDYCTDITGYDDMRPQPHYELCNLLEWSVGDCTFDHGSQKAALILLPRDTFKTSISVEALSSAVLTRNPNARILITSHKAKQASQRLSAVRRTFDRNEVFMAAYGDDWKSEGRVDKWSDSEFTVARRRNVGLREPSVQAAAVGADVTGSHYDLIIADDLVNLENCYTQESRDKVYDYLVSLFPHLEPGGTLLIVGTRWHADDAYGRLIRRDEERVRRGEKPRYIKLIRGCYDGPGGLFFPTRLTHEFLDIIKVDMGPRRFAANYLNQTIAEEDKTFRMEHLQEVEFDYFRTKTGAVIKTANGQYPVFTTMAWDTAGSKSTAKSDFHGITLVGTDSMSRWWVCESAGLKGTPTEIIEKVAGYILFYRPDILLIEAVGNYLHWVEALLRKLEPLGVSLNIQEVSHGGVPKQERIVMLEIPWNNRSIILKPGLKTLVEQLDSFSMASLPAHDDEIDSLAMHIGHTQPGEDGHREEFNPVDEEWVRRRKQARVNEATGIWRRGTRYET
jgi:hypothetical protein